ncbi:MAG: polysaccharide deacetylase family protein [Candidatus Brocadiae bacterium]|nr:polysaccharide deacetylase family protein [Candidatus Brocadiia bacterium]
MAQAHAQEPLFVAVTVDVDPDANRPQPGRADAVSPAGEARYDACFEGLGLLLNVLEGMGAPATFFWEARSLRRLTATRGDLAARVLGNASFEHGCHSHRHEDFAGKQTGLPLGPEETRGVLERAAEVFDSVLARAPQGFRAPYCRLTQELTDALAAFGYAYDASLTRQPGSHWRLRPFPLAASAGLWELALCRWRDRHGKPISSYLWQLCEGKRQVEDYVHVAASLRDANAGGLLQIALHPWHLVVSKDGGRLPAGHAGSPAARVEQVLAKAADIEGVKLTTAGAYLDRARTGTAAD